MAGVASAYANVEARGLFVAASRPDLSVVQRFVVGPWNSSATINGAESRAGSRGLSWPCRRSRPVCMTPQHWLRLAQAISRTLADSTRTDELLVAEELVCRGRFERLRRELADDIARDAEATALLRDRPRLARSDVDYRWLAALPAGTLGGAYARHLERFQLDPDVLAGPAGAASGAGYRDADAAYLHERYRQSHDLWHALTGLGVAGHEEVLLHAFTWAQLRLPYSALIVLFGAVKHMVLEGRWETLTRGLRDAWQAGRDAAPLLLVRWEDRWEWPVDRVRETFRVQRLGTADEVGHAG